MRGSVAITAVSKSFGGTAAVREVSLEATPGELLTLLGPSGCGKTTLLRLVAGFETPDRGRVAISGRDVTALPPYARPANTVFQHYALFPHRDVQGNVGFGLEMARLPRPEAAARVARVLETVRLAGLERRSIDQLSGGQRQRVALARALVCEPEVLLLDEPMSALDPKLRKQMQAELKALQRRLGTTFVFVTHDQEEALVLSDRIAVMSAGRIEQVGTPAELYERPLTRFVADFMGVRNLLEATIDGRAEGRVRLHTSGGLSLVAAGDPAAAAVVVGIRSERLALVDPGTTGENVVAGILEEATYLGDRTDWRVRAGGETLVVSEPAAAARSRRPGEAVRVQLPAADLLLFEP